MSAKEASDVAKEGIEGVKRLTGGVNEGYAEDEHTTPKLRYGGAENTAHRSAVVLTMSGDDTPHRNDSGGEMEMRDLSSSSHTRNGDSRYRRSGNVNRRQERTFESNCCIASLVIICIALCFVEILSYLADIVISISCLWGVFPEVAADEHVSNSTVSMSGMNQSTNITCDPYEAQENIPYCLIDILLALQPAIIILFWKCGEIAEDIEKYESSQGETPQSYDHKHNMAYRIRRTCYFLMVAISLSFLLFCVECATCSFSNPVIFIGTTFVGPVSQGYCPWLCLLLHLVLPAYCLFCWYATKMACVLRRRAAYIREYIRGKEEGADEEGVDEAGGGEEGVEEAGDDEEETIFHRDIRRPDIILRNLNRDIFHDKWHKAVWKHISFLMNIMMFFSATLVLLYTHVYISEVSLTLGEWSTHFTRLITIAALSVTPYLHVAFACVRVTEAYEYIYESLDKAQASRDSGRSNPESPRNTSQSAGASPRNNTDTEGFLDPLEYLNHRQLLENKVNKMCKAGLPTGVLGSSYTTRSGVHLAMLGVIFAMTWEVLDRFNDFDEKRAIALGNTTQEAFIVTLFGIIALVLFITFAIVVLCWERCCCIKNAGPGRARYNCFKSSKLKLALSGAACLVFILGVYVSFLQVVYKGENCARTGNPLFVY